MKWTGIYSNFRLNCDKNKIEIDYLDFFFLQFSPNLNDSLEITWNNNYTANEKRTKQIKAIDR